MLGAGVHKERSGVRIFDYVDGGVPMLQRMFEKRLRGYHAIGYSHGDLPVGAAPIAHGRMVELDVDELCEVDDASI